MTIKKICNNIMMVCGAITALVGAIGSVIQLIKKAPDRIVGKEVLMQTKGLEMMIVPSIDWLTIMTIVMCIGLIIIFITLSIRED